MANFTKITALGCFAVCFIDQQNLCKRLWAHSLKMKNQKLEIQPEVNSDTGENVFPAWDSLRGSLISLKTNQLFSVINFHPFPNSHFADILPSPGLRLGGMRGTVLSEIFFNVLISFFGRSPGSRYTQES